VKKVGLSPIKERKKRPQLKGGYRAVAMPR